jgi:hypothetical protein
MAHITLHPGEIILLVLVVAVDPEEPQAVLQDLLLLAIRQISILLLVAQAEVMVVVEEGSPNNTVRKKVAQELRAQ